VDPAARPGSEGFRCFHVTSSRRTRARPWCRAFISGASDAAGRPQGNGKRANTLRGAPCLKLDEGGPPPGRLNCARVFFWQSQPASAAIYLGSRSGAVHHARDQSALIGWALFCWRSNASPSPDRGGTAAAGNRQVADFGRFRYQSSAPAAASEADSGTACRP